MLPNNIVNPKYNGQWSEKEHFAGSSVQMGQTNTALHTTKSSSEWWQEQLGSIKGPSPWGIAQLAIKKMQGAEKTRETHFECNEEKENWIEDLVEWETAVARKRVENTESAIKKEQDDMINADNVGFPTREPETTIEEIMILIGDSMSNLASSDDEVDWHDEEEESTELGELSEHDEPSWVVGTISNTVERHMERFLPTEMMLDELTHLGQGEMAVYFRQIAKK